ncbi:MAG: CGNR zinc finger domain-containing protein [Burkholderiales bacterium]|nr:CGNR zinc finger domain-containing protein [Burkholderiales bacterium]
MSAAPAHVRWLRWSLHVDEASDGRPLCLSLANTRHWRNSAAPKELLNGYADILDWAVAKGIYSRREADALAAEANAHPHVANAELRRTIELREAIARVFGALAHGEAVREGDSAIIVESFDEAMRLMTLRVVDGRLVPGIPQGREGLELPRWQAAFSALGLYGSPAVARVKQCADDRGCGWLFVDTTRNASRMFCFSNECGNRARQAKYRERMRRAG